MTTRGAAVALLPSRLKLLQTFMPYVGSTAIHFTGLLSASPSAVSKAGSSD
jgi:hypothetical protein